MKLELINKNSIRNISNVELISLHRRVHQLIGLHRKYKVNLKIIHSILVNEMVRRKIKHISDLKEISKTIMSKEQKIKEEIIKMKASDKIKVLAMESAFKSNIPKKQKIEDMKFIKEKADPYQCIGYILDGKFYNLNESGKKELKKRLIKEQMVRTKQAASVVGAAGTTLGVGIAYKVARAILDKCQASCGTMGINGPKRQICIAKCHVVSSQQKLNKLRQMKADPEKIAKANQELIKFQTKLKKLQQWAVGTNFQTNPNVDPNKKNLFRAQ